MTFPLSQGLEAIIDVNELVRVEGMSWHVTVGTGGHYAHHTGIETLPDGSTRRVSVYMHRLIMKAKPNQIVRFKDGNTLNLTKSNMRLVQRVAPRKRKKHGGVG